MAENRNRDQQMKEITERLEQGVQELFTSEMYTKYLQTMSQFHNYSFNNTLLIAMQRPDATLVAGYQAWQKKFKRQVKRGEKGIQIIAPAPIKEKELVEKFDPETHEPILRPDGQPETEEVVNIIPRFRLTTVFDVSQTYGEPLAELDTPELMGSVENYENFMQAIREVSPVPIRFDEIQSDAKGYYSNVNKEIVIREGMSESQTMKTAVHEVTHAKLHDRDIMEELGEKKNKLTKEVEAESVAYTVCQYFGLDTSDYSFPYIAGWSSDMDMKELRSSMDTIRKTAGEFIDSMTEVLQRLMLEQQKKQHLENDDLVFKISGSMGSEYSYSIVQNVDKAGLLVQLKAYQELYAESGEKDIETFLEEQGVVLIPWYSSDGYEAEYPVNFFDVEYDVDTGITDAAELAAMTQATMLIDRAEYGKTLFNDEQKNLIVNYAFKFDNMEDTKELLQEMIATLDAPSSELMNEIMEQAQKEIDSLPDSMIGLSEMHEFGYYNDAVLPLTMERAVKLHHEGLHVYSLQKDGSRKLMNTELDILEVGGMFGIEAREWESHQVLEAVHEENTVHDFDHHSEEAFLNSDINSYGIYQLNSDRKGESYQFMGMDYVREQGISVDGADYQFIYGGTLTDQDTLNSLYDRFNIDHPEDFTGHSLSVSDVVVMKKDGEMTAHYVDSFGFADLPDFIRQREMLQVQDKETIIGMETDGYEVDGHEGTWHTIDSQEIQGEIFYLMEHDEYGDMAANVIVNREGRLVAEDLWNGFDDGAMETIAEYFSEKGMEFHAENQMGQDVSSSEQTTYPPVYKQTLEYAMEHAAADDYLDSRKLNLDCKNAIERAISENFDGMHLKHEAAISVVKEFGAERVSYVLANTVQHQSWDGRYSQDNKAWAESINVPENVSRGRDMNLDYVINSHPAVLDGFIGLARQEMLEQSKFIDHFYVVADMDADTQDQNIHSFTDLNDAVSAYFVLPNHLKKQLAMESTEQPPSRMPLITCRNGIDELEDIEAASLSGKWVNQEPQEAHQTVQNYLDNHDTEIAYQIGEDYFFIQSVDDGYDYTFYRADFSEIDGGVLENTDITIQEATHEIVEDFVGGRAHPPLKVIACEDFLGKVAVVEKAEIEHVKNEQAVSVSESNENKAIKEGPLISDNVTPEKNLNGKSRAEIEETVLCYAQAEIDAMGLTDEVKLHGARVYGTRTREGLYNAESDVDVVLSYTGNIREDAFFNALHEHSIEIAGLPIDINPISIEKTGTLEEFMENAEEYLDMKEAQKLAADIDQFSYEYDTYGYGDAVGSEPDEREANVHTLFSEIARGEITHLENWFHEIIMERYDLENVIQAKQLMQRLIDQTDKTRFIVKETPDVLEEPYAIYDRVSRDYYKGEDGSIPLFSSEQEAQETVDKMNEMSRKEKESDVRIEPSITFYVAECMEFHVLGEYHENIATLEEAMEIYEKIPSERMNGIKGIGFHWHDDSIYDGCECELMSCGKITKEYINEIPYFKDSPLVQRAIADMEKLLGAEQEKPAREAMSAETHTQSQGPQIAITANKEVITRESSAGQMKPSEKALKTEQQSEGSGKKQSVLQALRERQAKLKEQEQKKPEQKSQMHKKGDQEL